MLKHTFNTWSLANLFHPFVFIIFIAADDGLRFNSLGTPFVLYFFLGPFVSCLISLPLLFFGWLLLHFITKAELEVPEKFSIWLLAVSIIAMAYTCFLVMILNVDDLWVFFYGLPAFIAAFLAIVLRYDQLQKLFHSLQTDVKHS